MPSTTEATRCSIFASTSVASPTPTSVQGLPSGSVCASWAQPPTRAEKSPKSLPPIESVTREVSSVTASSCAGWAAPSKVRCTPIREVVSAPEQLTSASAVPSNASATSEG